MNDTEPSPPLNSDAITTGASLRSRREELGKSLAEVARELRLSPNKVEAIESGNLAVFAAPVYAQGYLRNYARLLGWDNATPPSWRQDTAAGRSFRQLGQQSLKPQIGLRDRPLQVATYAVVSLTVGMVAIWGYQDVSGTNGAPELIGEDPAAYTQKIAGAVAPVTGATESFVKDTQTRDLSAAIPSPNQVPIAADASAPVDNKSRIEMTPTEVPDIEGSVPAAANSASSAAPANEVALSLVYARDCWTEVKDATGRRLVYDLQPAGSRIAVTGVAPLEVFLGNADAVKIQVNGTLFNHPKDQRITRFSIDHG